MERVRVDYDPTPENLQVTEQANRPMLYVPDGSSKSGFNQLIKSLADHYPEFHNLQVWSQNKVEEQGVAWAERFDLEELDRKVKNGEYPEFAHPIFRVAVNSVDGQRQARRFIEETTDGIAKGTLAFKSSEDLELYLEKGGDGLVKGRDPAFQAGFYKGWSQQRETALRTNLGVQNEEFRKKTISVAQEFFNDTLNEGKTIGEALSSYRLFFARGMRTEDMRAGLQQNIMALVSQGKYEEVKALKKEKIGDITIGAILGTGSMESAEKQAYNVEGTEVLKNMENKYAEANDRLDNNPMDIGAVKKEYDAFKKEIHKVSKNHKELHLPLQNLLARWGNMIQQAEASAQASADVWSAFVSGTFAGSDFGISRQQAIKLIYNNPEFAKLSPDTMFQLLEMNGIPPREAPALKTLLGRISSPSVDAKGDVTFSKQDMGLLNFGITFATASPASAREHLGDDVYNMLVKASQAVKGGLSPEQFARNYALDNPAGTINPRYRGTLEKVFTSAGLSPSGVTDAINLASLKLPSGNLSDVQVEESAQRMLKDGTLIIHNGHALDPADLPNVAEGRNKTDVIAPVIEQMAKTYGLPVRSTYYLRRNSQGSLTLMDEESNMPVADGKGNTIAISQGNLKEYVRAMGYLEAPKGTGITNTSEVYSSPAGYGANIPEESFYYTPVELEDLKVDNQTKAVLNLIGKELTAKVSNSTSLQTRNALKNFRRAIADGKFKQYADKDPRKYLNNILKNDKYFTTAHQYLKGK